MSQEVQPVFKSLTDINPIINFQTDAAHSLVQACESDNPLTLLAAYQGISAVALRLWSIKYEDIFSAIDQGLVNIEHPASGGGRNNDALQLYPTREDDKLADAVYHNHVSAPLPDLRVHDHNNWIQLLPYHPGSSTRYIYQLSHGHNGESDPLIDLIFEADPHDNGLTEIEVVGKFRFNNFAAGQVQTTQRIRSKQYYPTVVASFPRLLALAPTLV